MKWFLAAVVVLLGVSFALWQRNAVKTSYVNGLSQYNTLPGREYIFERDCYIFKQADWDTSWPLVAAHATMAALPEKVDPKNLGTGVPNLRLLDVVRTGARFKIVSVRRDESRKGSIVTFEILFLDEAARKYPRLDAYYLLDHGPETAGAAPTILPAYAVERVAK